MTASQDTDERLTADSAADIARGHGLTLSDAQALLGLADTTGEAQRLAAKFRPEEDFADRLAREYGNRYR